MSSLGGEQILVLSRGLCWKILLFLFNQKHNLPFNNIVFTDIFCVNKVTIDEILENNHVVQLLGPLLRFAGPVVLKFLEGRKTRIMLRHKRDRSQN